MGVGRGGGGGAGGYGPFKNITHISNRSFIKGGRKPKNTGKRVHNLVPVQCLARLACVLLITSALITN